MRLRALSRSEARRTAVGRAWRSLLWPVRRGRYSPDGRDEARRFDWIFILGCNNSGTSILYNLLGLHPAISPLPVEGHKLTSVLPHPEREGCPRLWTRRQDLFRLNDETHGMDAARLVYDWLGWSRKPAATFIMEKSPPDTLRSIWLQKVFGRCHFVGIVRNGYAVSEGIRRRNGYPIDQCARHWSAANRSMLEDASRLERFTLVRYEHLVADPAAAAERVAAWLGVETGTFAEVADRKFVTHHVDSTPGKIEDYNARNLARLSEEDVRLVTREAGEMLDRFGYSAGVPGGASEVSASGVGEEPARLGAAARGGQPLHDAP